GTQVILDSPEHLIAAREHTGASAVASFVHDLDLGLRFSGWTAVVNLNAAAPPAWAKTLAEGPLFAPPGSTTPATMIADMLVENLASAWSEIRIDWHLGERDFQPGSDSPLLRVIRKALETNRIAFVFDRPRRPVALAEGLRRGDDAALLVVGLGL